MKSLLPTEAEIQKSIIEYLKLKKYYVQRLNSGAMMMQSKGKSYMMRMSEAGTPDIMAFKSEMKPVIGFEYISVSYMRLFFIEVKRNKKARATELQVAKMKELEDHGAKCIIACSIEDLKEHGL